MNRLFLAPFFNWARKLKHPTLFKLVGAIFLVNLFLPDPLPFFDEILLGLGTMLLASWKDRNKGAEDLHEPIDGSASRR